MTKPKVLVVGGGPAGMSAALTAAENGADVTLLERRSRPGKKLLATGNGRCNLANRGKPVYFGDPAFASRVMAVCGTEVMLKQLRQWGIELYTDPEGRVYPAAQQASSVLSVLTARMEQRRVRLSADADVKSAVLDGDRCRVTLSDGTAYTSDRLILATGGLAGGGLGNREEDYALATGFGHHLTRLFSGLAPLELDLGQLRRLSGLRVPVRVQLICDGKAFAAAGGEALFTDYGLSGICVMQLARDAQIQLQQGKHPSLSIDFSPVFFPETRAYTREPEPVRDAFQRTCSLISERMKSLGPDGALTGLIPDALAAVCPSGNAGKAAAFLTGLVLPVTGVRPMAQAQITCGGIDTREVDPDTMASRMSPRLYLTGEMLNVDGDCGGFNLQFAFATGMIAGRNAAGV